MEKGKVVDKRVFPRDPKAIAKKLSAECPEERELRAKYPKAGDGKERLDMSRLAEELGFCKKNEYGSMLSKINQEKSKVGVKEGFGKGDLVINAVRAQKQVEDEFNTMSETLREWYSIHFPELNGLLKDNFDYAKVVSDIGSRAGMSEDNLKKVLSDKRFARAISDISKESMGSDVAESDLDQIREYAALVSSCGHKNDTLKGYVEKSMTEMMPNVAAVATPYVGALLLEQAGSVERLAKLPASTIQVLGAQKAMFRFLRTHKLPPKYGVIYVHPLVSQAGKTLKGKVARTLAGKISLAAKVDFYGGNFIGDKLKSDMEKRVKSLRE